MSEPKIILTRSEEDIKKDAPVFRKKGFEIVELPLIKTLPLDFEVPIESPDYIVFQSAKAVKFFLENRSLPAESTLVAVGRKTAKALRSKGYKADLISEESSAEGLIKLFKKLRKGSVLVPRSAIGRREFIDFLKTHGFEVYPLDVYTITHVFYEPEDFKEKLSRGNIITFASPSAVDGFFANLDRLRDRSILNTLIVSAIGKTTKKALLSMGIKADVVASEPSIETLAEETYDFWLKNCKH